MRYRDSYEKYKNLLTTLKKIIEKSHDRVKEGDDIFYENVNFFVKAYLISICTYLEAYLQDIAFEYSGRVSERIKQAKIPHNFLYGNFVKEKDKNGWKYTDASVTYSKEDLSDMLSGNPGRTIEAFRSIGIDLQSSRLFTKHKDLVGTIVYKRNQIIHHNDDASDITFDDLSRNIEIFLEYMVSIADLITEKDGDA